MPLQIIIAGAGIAGATAACALAAQGHHVTLYERRAGVSPSSPAQRDESHAGIQLQPNGVRILRQLGMLDAVDEVSHNSYYTDFRDYRDGSSIVLADYERRGGVRFGTRGDLKEALLREAQRREGVDVVLGVGVVGVRERGESVVVRLTDGRELEVDLVVGADGTFSKVRASLFPDYTPHVLDCVVYQMQVPLECVDEAPHKGGMDRTKGAFCLWTSPGRAATASPSPKTGEYDLQLIDGEASLARDPEPEKRLGWFEDVGMLRKRWADHSPMFRALVEKADRYYKWRLVEVTKLPAWSSAKEGSGRVVLVGDAAHGMAPMAGQGSAMGIEDGAVLAELLSPRYLSPSEVSSSADLRRLMAMFEKIRKPRCDLVQALTTALRKFWIARDPKMIEAIRASTKTMNWKDYFAVEPDRTSPFHTAPFQRWLDVYNVHEEVRKVAETDSGLDKSAARKQARL